MRFEEALAALREGGKVKRSSWEKVVSLSLVDSFTVRAEYKDAPALPFDNIRISDVMADDWQVVGTEVRALKLLLAAVANQSGGTFRLTSKFMDETSLKGEIQTVEDPETGDCLIKYFPPGE